MPDLCATCGLSITSGSIITLGGASYHATCFRCSDCRTSLEAQTSGVHTRDGKPFCQPCWTERFAERCGACEKCFTPKQRIVVFGGKKLHPACFVCAGRCGTCLGDEGASRFHQKDGAPYCHSCFTERFAPRCGVCSRPIEGGTRYIVHKGVKIHQSCFCCVECGVALSNGHYEHDGLVYCAEDYARRFGETCALCSEKLLAWITVPTGESYCRSHQGQAPPCFACGRLVDVAKAKPTTGIDLADGRVSCMRTAQYQY